jgi:hypothetical protein
MKILERWGPAIKARRTEISGDDLSADDRRQ